MYDERLKDSRAYHDPRNIYLSTGNSYFRVHVGSRHQFFLSLVSNSYFEVYFFELYAFIIPVLTSTLVLGINYLSYIMTA